MAVELRDFSWKRMIEAVEAVRERMLHATSALRTSGIPYAVAGGNAVAAWVASVDRAAVRNTQDVYILVRKADFAAIKGALESVGFEYRQIGVADCFTDGPGGSPRDSIHLIYVAEQGLETLSTKGIAGTEYRVLTLEALVDMLLTSFRREDQMHLRDLLDVCLIDSSWIPRLLPEHAARLQQLIDDPDG